MPRTEPGVSNNGRPGAGTNKEDEMKRWLVPVLVAVVVVAAMPAAAGEGHCKGSADDCLKKMATKMENKAWLGVELDANEHGYYTVTRVVAGSPAEAAGFEAGDVMLAVNGVKWNKENKDAVSKASHELKPGSTADYVVKRSGDKVKLTATLDRVPREVMAQWIGEHMLSDHTNIQMASK